MKKEIKCKVLQDGMLPIKAHKTDAGFDVYATYDFEIRPGEVIKHPLNVCLELPESSYAEITSKSGNGLKGLLVYAGIIDEGYRGIVHVIMTNVKRKSLLDFFSNRKTIKVKKGQKIAQMIMHPYSSEYELIQVDEIDNNTDRGAGGFGSTGNSLV
jgi:dUTP pyrophosphatase